MLVPLIASEVFMLGKSIGRSGEVIAGWLVPNLEKNVTIVSRRQPVGVWLRREVVLLAIKWRSSRGQCGLCRSDRFCRLGRSSFLTLN
jgi:hypothetical protein